MCPLVLALFLLVPRPIDSKPTREELRARVAELAKKLEGSTTYDDLERACRAFDRLGPPARVQALLAEEYPGAPPGERLAILHVLDKVGVEAALAALPAIARDFGVARPKHPNAMSFASGRVLEQFQRLAWSKLPEREREPDRPEGAKPRKERPRISADGLVSPGTLADRETIRRTILADELNRPSKKGRPPYPVPAAIEDDWVRVLADHAFVRLRGPSSGVDLLFVRGARGDWRLVAVRGHWVN